MKIQCDVCNKNEASLFCTADEAALCDACDHRVHHANKLASKHQRFSLHRPSLKQYPVCDICKEKRAFVFCQQDRAILCEECDLSIHSANEHTQKHSRFLLTGIKLSASAKLYSSTTTTTTTLNDSNSTKSSSQSSVINISHPTTTTTVPLMANKITTPTPASTTPSKAIIEGAGSTTTSSISEYLMNTLPGWQVEDFLDSSSVPFSFYKSDDMLPMFDVDIQENLGSFPGIWVPQASPPPLYFTEMDRQIENKGTKDGTNIKRSSRSRLRDDNNFIVPQISPDSNTKRPRFLW
ncbi:hypothetical protein RIF29_06189 [Crotalaria pallida]|uniref:B box-type domain-containing protein n=1 Tax=Crotalaria pallida TaxID=3830 RepID=A0AAN9J4F2_CROPI